MSYQHTDRAAHIEHSTYLAVEDGTHGGTCRAQYVDTLIVKHHSRQSLHGMLSVVAYYLTSHKR